MPIDNDIVTGIISGMVGCALYLTLKSLTAKLWQSHIKRRKGKMEQKALDVECEGFIKFKGVGVAKITLMLGEKQPKEIILEPFCPTQHK